MSRFDNIGLFWNDESDREKKQKDYLLGQGWEQIPGGLWIREDADEENGIDFYELPDAYKIARSEDKGEKRTPPEPFWLESDYLPNYDTAVSATINVFPDSALINAVNTSSGLVFDIEVYINYCLFAFKCIDTGMVIYFECNEDGLDELSRLKLQWVLENFLIITFNGINYDIPLALIALAGHGSSKLKSCSDMIIQLKIRHYQILKDLKIKNNLSLNHIDIKEVAPLSGSLKIYGGRGHSRTLQDLPFHESAILSEKQITILRWYCINDLDLTEDLFKGLPREIKERYELSKEYGVDVRSKSDAQIAEAVIKVEMERMLNRRIFKPSIEPGTIYYYKPPHFLQYRSELMQWVLQTIRTTIFQVKPEGGIETPPIFEKKQFKVTINETSYTMGIGGLHSCEKKTCYHSSNEYILKDWDVTSYYPFIILNTGIFPQHLGPLFLKIYRKIVEKRLNSKSLAKDKSLAKELLALHKSIAATLKIVINGSFGKLGSKYSILYSPDLLIQVTLTGQLSLLMLIERLELEGIQVVSANTDGVVVKCHRSKESLMNQICSGWEADTGFELEGTEYAALYSRDVNNYVAVKDDKTEIKTKGAYSRPGYSKNPVHEISIDAIENLLLHGTHIETTIRECTDIRKFVTVRNVKGGAVKDKEFLGKVIRWYYSTEASGEIIYASSGNKVPKTDGAKPLMVLPEKFPEDIDYERYIAETQKMLKDMAYA